MAVTTDGRSDLPASVTIEDVAARAGVSVATVSRALRGLPNVAPSTREKVLVAARELHYVADPSASRLASGRTLTVGVVVPMLGQWYYARVYAGIEGALGARGYDLLPFATAGPDGAERFLRTLPFRKRVDGLVVVDALLGRGQLDRVVSAGAPVVTVGRQVPGASSVRIEDATAARLAVNHLTGLGHRRVAVLGRGGGELAERPAQDDRVRGYREALVAADLPIDPDLEVPAASTFAGGAEAMAQLLHLAEPPSAVFALCDDVAIGAMQVARDAGLRVPEDVSVVGFDDQDVAAYLGLTTVHQDVRGLGERAAQLLLAALDGRRGGAAAVHELAATRLVVRATTAPPARGRRWRR